MRVWALVLMAMLGLPGMASAEVVPQRKWLQVRSPHFTIMGEVGVRELRRVAERMEHLHATLGQLTGTVAADTGDVTVIVFKDARSFQPFQPRYNGKPVPVAGYFLPGPMNYIGILADRDYDYASVVYHEYVHLVTGRGLGVLPLWMSEGLAEFYSTFEAMDGGRTVQLGKVPVHHLERLRYEFLPLATLTSVGRDSAFYNERDKSSAFYAESWAFVHFLYLGRQQKYAARVPRFFEAILGGTPFEAACVQHLGTTVPALEQELRQYLGSLIFTAMRASLPESLRRLDSIDATPIAEGEAHAVLAQLLLFLDEGEEARAHLDHALTVDPRQPLAAARLAELVAGAGRSEEALALIGRSSDSPGASYLSQFYRASALERLAPSSAASPAAIVAAWQQVVDLNPNFAEGHARLAQARADGRDDLDDALRLQRRALQLAPARDDYVLGLARILIMQGETKRARDLLGPLVARGSSAAIKTAARSYLGVAAQVELARAAGTESPRPERPPDTSATPEAPPRVTGASLPDAPPPTPPRTAPPAAPAELIPDLHRPLDDERQVFGTLTDIACTGTAAVLVTQTVSGTVRVRGGTLDTIDFVSFRSDLAGGINCGAQPQAPPVVVTYRPEPEGNTVGEVVIVEVVPLGFKPPGK